MFDFLPENLRKVAGLLAVCVSLVSGGWFAGSKFQNLESRVARIEIILEKNIKAEREPEQDVLVLHRKDGREAEGAGLLNQYTGNCIEGSNPSPSAEN